MMLSPLVQAGALQNSQSPVDTRGGGDGISLEPFAIPALVNIAHFRKVNTALMWQFCASGAMFLLANFSGPKAAGKLNKLPRSVHYWADLATFSRFYWHARWVPTTLFGC